MPWYRMWGKASSAVRGSIVRRRERRRRALIVLLIFILGAGIVLLIGLRQRAVRISHIQIFGNSGGQPVMEIVQNAMKGSYLGIIPRDSIFFFPASRMRREILAAYPEIAAVSLFRNGPTDLTVKTIPRIPIARWCGSTSSLQAAASVGVKERCYVFDASGYIFATLSEEAPDPLATTTIEVINPFTLYAPLVGETPEPLRATIAHAEKLPATFDLARKLASFGSPVKQIIAHDDEVDDILASGTRITYVLGDELPAFTALTSAHANLNLVNGSVEYIDLRFDRKVYVKRR